MRDLTRGDPLKQILLFALPALIGNFFETLYSFVDTIIVGRTLGANALAAVGACGILGWLVDGFCLGITTGCSIFTAQKTGAKDPDGVRRSLATHGFIAVIMALVFTSVFASLTGPILRVMNTPENILADATTYLRIVYLGLPGLILYNVLCCTMRSLGDSKTPLYFLIVSSVLNLVGDLVLILVFHMGVAGAALATSASKLLAGIACLVWVIFRVPQMHLRREDLRITGHDLYNHIRLGLPMGAQFSVGAIGGIILQRMLNGFGADAVAGYTVFSRVDNVTMILLITLGSSLATFVGQNRGAERYDRIRTGVHRSLVVSIVLSFVISAVVMLLTKPIISLFVSDPSEDVIYYAKMAIFWCYIAYFTSGILFIYRNALQGIGAAAATLIGPIIEVVVKVVLTMFLGKLIGFLAVAIATPLAWLLSIPPMMYFFYRAFRRMSGGKAEKESSPVK